MKESKKRTIGKGNYQTNTLLLYMCSKKKIRALEECNCPANFILKKSIVRQKLTLYPYFFLLEELLSNSNLVGSRFFFF